MKKLFNKNREVRMSYDDYADLCANMVAATEMLKFCIATQDEYNNIPEGLLNSVNERLDNARNIAKKY